MSKMRLWEVRVDQRAKLEVVRQVERKSGLKSAGDGGGTSVGVEVPELEGGWRDWDWDWVVED